MSAWPDNLCLSCDVICPLHFLNFANQLWDKHDPRESHLWTSVLGQLSRSLAEDEVLAVDAGVKISDLQKAGITPVRGAASRELYRPAQLPVLYRGHGRGLWGAHLLARRYKDKTLPASRLTGQTWREAGQEIKRGDLGRPGATGCDPRSHRQPSRCWLSTTRSSPILGCWPPAQVDASWRECHLPEPAGRWSRSWPPNRWWARTASLCMLRRAFSVSGVGTPGGVDLELFGRQHRWLQLDFGIATPSAPGALPAGFTGPTISAKLSISGATAKRLR